MNRQEIYFSEEQARDRQNKKIECLKAAADKNALKEMLFQAGAIGTLFTACAIRQPVGVLVAGGGVLICLRKAFQVSQAAINLQSSVNLERARGVAFIWN